MIPIAQPNIGEDEIKAVSEVLRSGRLAKGPVVQQFENRFAEFCGVKHAIAVNSGTAALHSALACAGITTGDEVIVPAFTFFATASSVMMCGAKPVFADIDINTYNVNPESIEEKITGKTKAVIGVDIFGQPCDIDWITDLCSENAIMFFEDAAQSHGAEYNSKKTGSFGKAGCFSFYATKNMTTGEGGMITTNNKEYADTIREFINHGQHSKYIHDRIGYNYRMTDIAAAIGLIQLEKLPALNQKRISNANYYEKHLTHKDIIKPHISRGSTHVFHQYSIRITDKFSINRFELMEYLKSNNIDTAIHYPVSLNRQPAFNQTNKRLCPVADQLSNEILSLPVHPGVTEPMLKKICTVINGVR